MARYAILEDGVAVNFAEADATYASKKGWVLAPTQSQGDTWDGKKWTAALAPAPAVPESVTNAQGSAALIQAGLWTPVLGYVEGIANPLERALAEVTLHKTADWRRDNVFLNEAATALGLTTEQIDALFIAASEIVL